MIAGVSDPMAMLRLSFDEWSIFCSVVERALKLKDEREVTIVKALCEGVGAEVGNTVSKILSRMT